MTQKVLEARPGLIGSTMCGEKIAYREEPLPSGKKNIISPINETATELTVKTARFNAVFSADGKMRLEGPVLSRETFKSQAIFRADGTLGVGGAPRKGRLFVEVDGDEIRYGSLEHPNVVFSNNGGIGKLNNPYIVIGSPLLSRLGGELGDVIRKESPRKTPGFKHPDFSFVASKDGGMEFPNVMIKPMNSTTLKKVLGDTETGVVVGMVHGNIPSYLPKVLNFMDELERLKEHKEVVEFLEKHRKQ
jgi:hypothetical protein